MRASLLFLKQQWFLALLVGTVTLGLLYPAPGLWVHKHLGPEPFIFILQFFSSFALNTSELLGGFRAPTPMLLSLLGTYLVMPAVLYASALALGLNSPLGVGLVVMGAAPTTMASAAIWTRLAGGNTALSVGQSVVSNVVNVLLGPAVLWVTFGQALEWPLGKIVLNLAEMVLLPVLLGQIAGRILARRRGAWIPALTTFSRLLLIWVVVQAASKASAEAGGGLAGASGESHALSVGQIALLLALCLAAHLVAVGVMEISGRWLGLARGDRIATLFVGGQKTLPVALLLLNRVSPAFALGVVSMVAYHAIQLIFDSFLIEVFRRSASVPGVRAPERDG